MKRRINRSVRIERRFPGHYEVIKYRKDGEGRSVGYSKTRSSAKRIKKKNLWGKTKK